MGLLPRDGEAASIVWCRMEPCFVFHIANAYDAADGAVVMDVVAYDTMFATGAGGLDSLGRLERWTLDPLARRVSREVLDPSPHRVPARGQPPLRPAAPLRLQRVRAPGWQHPACRRDDHLQARCHARTREVRDFGPGRVPGEFVFVPRGPGEDEGWLMGLVVNVQADTTDLVILDAQAFTGPPVATVHLPHRIPPGFHGNWFPAGASQPS